MCPCHIDLFTSCLTRQLPRFFMLEAGPGSRENRCLQPGLISHQELCQSPLVFDLLLPITDQMTECQSHTDHSSLEHTVLVPNHTGNDGGLPLSSTSQGPGSSANESGLHNKTRGSGTNSMAYLRESFTSQ